MPWLDIKRSHTAVVTFEALTPTDISVSGNVYTISVSDTNIWYMLNHDYRNMYATPHLYL